VANILTVTGGATSLVPTTSWAAPNGLFPTTDRNDGTVYGWASSTSTLTLPASAEGDGYLVTWGFELTDTSSGRSQSSGRIVQTSGTGNFASAVAGGYTRDSSNNQSYASGWAFIDNPSASAQLQFQFVRDSDPPTGGTSRSFLQVIPLSYSDVGVYTSTSTSLPGGTTPTQMTGFSGTDGTNITMSSNTVTVTGSNKRYLAMGSVSLFDSSFSTRTQRWCGFREDGTKDDAAKSCMYIRNTSNDRIGSSFMSLYETSAASKTIDVFAYRGDGIAAGEGGADADGGTTVTAGAHAIVVVELNDSAEVFHSEDGTAEQALTSANTDLTISATSDIAFNDSASFTRSSDTAVNIVQSMDVLLFANVGQARETVSSFTRWEGEGSFTVGGTTQSPVGIHGNFNRGDVGDGTLGSSYNSVGAYAATSSDTVGYRHVRNSSSEDVTTQPSWVGFNAINLDTLEGGGVSVTGTLAETQADQTLSASGSVSVTGTVAETQANQTAAISGSVTVTGTLAETQDSNTSTASGSVIVNVTGSLSETQAAQTLAASGSLIISGSVAETEAADTSAASGTVAISGSVSESQDNQTLAASGTMSIAGTVAETQADNTLAASGTAVSSGAGTLSVVQDNNTVSASGTVTIAGTVSASEDADTLAASGTVITDATGTLSETQDNNTLAGNVVVLADAVRSNRHTLSPVAIRSSASPSTKRHTISEVEIRRTNAPSKV